MSGLQFRRLMRPVFAAWTGGERLGVRDQVPRLRKVITPGWISLGIALVSFWFAVEARSLASREPEVLFIGPEHVRLAQGDDFNFAYFYLQPAFVSTGQNDRVEVIRDMHVEVVRAPDSTSLPPAAFEWRELARLTQDPVDNSLNYEYLADAMPLLISPRMAQQPFCVFYGPPGWYFQPGEYQLRLVATTIIRSQRLSFDFLLSLSADDVSFLNKARGNQFLNFSVVEVH